MAASEGLRASTFELSECAKLPGSYADGEENNLSRSVSGIFVNESDNGEGLHPGNDGPNFDHMIDAYVFERTQYVWSHEGR